MKNQFAKALKAKQAKVVARAGDQGRAAAGGAAGRRSERTEQIKNRKVLSSTRADKK